MCSYCHFKTNPPALIAACESDNLDTVIELYKAGFSITTQLATESYKASFKDSMTFVHTFIYIHNHC